MKKMFLASLIEKEIDPNLNLKAQTQEFLLHFLIHLKDIHTAKKLNNSIGKLLIKKKN